MQKEINRNLEDRFQKHSFDLGRVNTIQEGKRYLVWGAYGAFCFFFIRIVLVDYLKVVSVTASIPIFLIVFYFGITMLNKLTVKRVKIEFGPETISLFYNGQLKYRALMENFKGLRTLFESPKNEVQGELILNDKKFSFAQNGNTESQDNWEAFYFLLNKTYNFEKTEVPFSVWTHNWQGVKYVEFTNPKFKENEHISS